jgi:hypothetical protein
LFLKDQDDVNEQIILVLDQLFPEEKMLMDMMLIVSLIQFYIDPFSFVIILNNLLDISE